MKDVILCIKARLKYHFLIQSKLKNSLLRLKQIPEPHIPRAYVSALVVLVITLEVFITSLIYTPV